MLASLISTLQPSGGLLVRLLLLGVGIIGGSFSFPPSWLFPSESEKKKKTSIKKGILHKHRKTNGTWEHLS